MQDKVFKLLTSSRSSLSCCRHCCSSHCRCPSHPRWKSSSCRRLQRWTVSSSPAAAAYLPQRVTLSDLDSEWVSEWVKSRAESKKKKERPGGSGAAAAAAGAGTSAPSAQIKACQEFWMAPSKRKREREKGSDRWLRWGDAFCFLLFMYFSFVHK